MFHITELLNQHSNTECHALKVMVVLVISYFHSKRHRSIFQTSIRNFLGGREKSVFQESIIKISLVKKFFFLKRAQKGILRLGLEGSLGRLN